jgi:hypothetical protein
MKRTVYRQLDIAVRQTQTLSYIYYINKAE